MAYGQGDNQGGEIGYGSDVSSFHEVGTNTVRTTETRQIASSGAAPSPGNPRSSWRRAG